MNLTIIILVIIVILVSVLIWYFYNTLYYRALSKKRDQTSMSDIKQTVLNTPTETITAQSEIPKILIQTYSNKNKVPQKVFDGLSKFAPEYKYYFYDDKACLSLIKKNFTNEVLQAYLGLKNTAHKADLFRYCVLYLMGGVYLDIKTELIKPLSQLINPGISLYTVLAAQGNSLYQGIIASKPRNDIFLKLIYFITLLPSIFWYQTLTKDFYHVLSQLSKLKPGLIGSDTYLFQEKLIDKSNCPDGLDKYGFCSFIFDNNIPVFKTRYSDFPW